MFYPHHQTSQQAANSATAKHHPHEAPSGLNGELNLRAPGASVGGWGRQPFNPSGMPMPSPSAYPSANGMLGYPPPGSHHGHHGHQLHHHGAVGQHVHPQHPNFGNAVGGHLQPGAGGMGHPNGGSFGGMGMFGGSGAVGNGGGGSPPRAAAETVPMTAFWQHQLLRAEASRIASAPHHRARSAAMASRMTNKPSAVIISDPNLRPASIVNGVHQKNASATLSVGSFNDRALTPPPSDPSSTPTMAAGAVDPANPQQVPVLGKEESKSSEPWTGLDLGGIKLRTLSKALFSFNHITSLYVNHNSLTSLPPSISALRQLTLLDATGNELGSLPPELGVLCKLKDLLLFDNHLTTLPPEIGTLYQLETLGIDGNPLDERLRKILAEDGTTALIQHLRDTCPVAPPPPERQWIEIDPDVPTPSSGKQETFTVLTYNILCHSFAPSMAYSYTPAWALDWNYRKQTILQEIVNASADVVCLQEIDCEQFADFFYPELKEHGYDGSHYPRTRARTMAPEEAKLVDGCAVLWKADRFSLVETQVVEFNQVALQKIDMRTDDMFNRVMSRDNIAVVAALEFRASGARIIVSNSHIFWDHRYRDVKLVQIGMLMEELEKIVERFAHLPAKLTSDPEFNNGRGPPFYDRNEKGRDIPLILCVDLNSLAGSAVYDFLSTGELQPDHEDFMSHAYGSYTNKGLRTNLSLRSACSSFGEMKMTNFTPTFDEAIDYIFYSPRSLKVTSVLGDVDRGYLEKTVGFPNAHFPSDHIPVFAQFRVRGHS